MDTFKTILNHRSIRKYKNEPVSDELLKQILEAGFSRINHREYASIQHYCNPR